MFHSGVLFAAPDHGLNQGVLLSVSESLCVAPGNEALLEFVFPYELAEALGDCTFCMKPVFATDCISGVSPPV